MSEVARDTKVNESAERKKDGIDRAAPFSLVLNAELKQIDTRRERLKLADAGERAVPDPPVDEPDGEEALARAEKDARERRLVGLSFSGGGIRSASFNLGVLQGLAGMGLLRFFDYLSTVSGGGYIGSWLAAWIYRQPGGIASVERQLAANREERSPTAAPSADIPASVPLPQTEPPAGLGSRGEPQPIRHLRRFSNYLAPRTGFLSADSWVLAAIYLRNFLLSLLVLVPAVLAVLLLSRLAMLAYFPLPNYETPPPVSFLGMAILTGAFWLAAFVLLLQSALRIRERDEPLSGVKRMRPSGMNIATLLMLVSAVLFCWFAPYWLPLRRSAEPADLCRTDWGLVGYRVGIFAAVLAILAVIGYLICLIFIPREVRPDRKTALMRVGAMAVSGMFGGALLYGTYCLLHSLYDGDGAVARDYLQARATAQLTTFGPPIVLGAIFIGFSLGIGILGRWLGEARREWWASLFARMLIAAGFWVSVNLIALYGTALVLWAGPWLRLALGSGWLLTVLAGVLAGGGTRTNGKSEGANRGSPGGACDLLARLAPHVFLAGILIAISLLLHVTLDNPPAWRNAPETVWVREVIPELPSTRVSQTRVYSPDDGNGPEKVRRDTVEREETINAGEVVRQMYWVGILNTDPHFVPHERFRVSKWDMARLECEGIPCDIRSRIPTTMQSDQRTGSLERAEFFKELDAEFPPENTPYWYRARIIRYAKEVESMTIHRLSRFSILFGSLLVCVGVVALAAWRVDVNLFSLHSLYGNRLVRAFLGASRSEASARGNGDRPRSPDPATGLDPDDDLHLARLRADGPAGYDGPFPIVNTALNLVAEDKTEWQERKGASFVLTPLFCGSELTGYRVTSVADPVENPGCAGYGGNLMLGTAITLSGAAASPNMGYHSSPSVTALLTVFNARLGAWLGNPGSRDDRWRSAGPQMGFLHLFRELFGLTRSTGGYVYLSDGGHFENLGAYELIRRRCQYLVVCDSGQDRQYVFEDLGSLIRKCRIDFGIRIQIELDSLRPQADGGRSRWHCAVGTVRYDDVDPGAIPGTLIYLKPSLTGDEPADVLHYAELHRDFPHEGTGDQFFSESQFESYRRLGQHVVEAVFEQSVSEMRQTDPFEADDQWHAPTGRNPAQPDGQPRRESTTERHRRRCRQLFSSLVRRWFAMPPEYETTFLESTAGYVSVQEALRSDARLWHLTGELYPEQVSDHPAPEDNTEQAREQRRSVELSVIAQMFQVMQNAWLSLNLDVHYAHPLNRGWMGVFHRWTSARTVRECWPLLRAEFGRGFVSFCERQMRMGVVEGTVNHFSAADVPPLLAREFRDQWPGLPGLQERMHRAVFADNRRLSWLVQPTAPSASDPVDQPGQQTIPCGIILVHAPEEGDDRQTATPPAEPVYELFVWMRGTYRNSGLGRAAVQQALEGELFRRCPRPFRLQVRLPGGSDMPGPGGKLQRGIWLTFFHHYEFVRLDPVQSRDEGAEEREVVLERLITNSR